MKYLLLIAMFLVACGETSTTEPMVEDGLPSSSSMGPPADLLNADISETTEVSSYFVDEYESSFVESAKTNGKHKYLLDSVMSIDTVLIGGFTKVVIYRDIVLATDCITEDSAWSVLPDFVKTDLNDMYNDPIDGIKSTGTMSSCTEPIVPCRPNGVHSFTLKISSYCYDETNQGDN